VIESDVAAPDRSRARAAHRIDQARGLRIVEDHDVLRVQERNQFRRVRGQRPFVRGPLRVARPGPVAVESVQVVVQSLGELEERGVA
jgi:hypothetical protein